MARMVILFLGFLASGCMTTIVGDTYTASTWRSKRERLGKVVVVPTRGVTGRDATDITRLTTEAVARLPGAQVITPEPFLAELGGLSEDATVSDYEAVIAARKLGIDTVCLMTVGHYDWGFGFSWLVPVWKTETMVLYDLRLLSADSGKLLLDTVRERSTGGFYAITTRKRLPHELASELADVLSSGGETADTQILAMQGSEGRLPKWVQMLLSHPSSSSYDT